MNFNDIFASPDTMLEHRTWVEPNRLTDALDLGWVDYSEEFETRVEKFFVVGANWICTDTRVGLAVYTFDGVPVAVSAQPARKSSEDIKFVTVEAAKKVREFMLSLNAPTLSVVDDISEPIASGWFEHQPPYF